VEDLRFYGRGSHTLNKRTAQPCRSIMPHNVVPINAAVYIKSKNDFRQPTVRRSLRDKDHKEGRRGFCPKVMCGLYDKITDKNALFLLCDLLTFVFFVWKFSNNTQALFAKNPSFQLKRLEFGRGAFSFTERIKSR